MGHIEFAGVCKIMTREQKKTRVLFLFAHLHKGGMQRAVSNISMALPDEFEQYVGFFGTENPSFEYHATLHDFDVPGSLASGLMGKTRNFLVRIYKLRKFVKKRQIDVVVSFGNAANILNALAFISAYRVLCIRGAIGAYGENKLYERIYQLIIPWVYRLGDAIIAVSDDLKKEIMSMTAGEIPVRHIPNLYHLEKIRRHAEEPLPEALSYLNNRCFILNVGSLISLKGQDLLISAFANLRKNHPDLLLVLIGSGHDKDKYIAEAQRLGVEEGLTVVDFDPNPYRYMKQATVFVLSSRTEGFPNVLVEAMACDCPVVAFDCPTGPREILGNSEYGELLENMTAEALTIKLDELLSSDERLVHLKEQAIKRAAHYDANHVIGQWINVLSAHR
jgi:GalNAc-alpha-(1->4)-GalNAc-alpha-(1->3)-diNAcBac-PP-undecaprenol alpha-1,4-N-acetyl-D-galactosaminyltransferase